MREFDNPIAAASDGLSSKDMTEILFLSNLPTPKFPRENYTNIPGNNSVEILPTWLVRYNTKNEATNAHELAERKQEITATPELRDYYVGDIYGMAVFEGPVAIMDERQPNGLSYIFARVIVGRDVMLPTYFDFMNGQASAVNMNPFSELFFRELAQITGGFIGVPDSSQWQNPELLMARDTIFGLIDQYEQTNTNNETDEQPYPVTIISGEGAVTQNREHIIEPSPSEAYPTNMLLRAIARAFPLPHPDRKPPVLLVSCNETEGRNSTFYSPYFKIFYRKGVVGHSIIAQSTGKMYVSK